MIIKQKYVEYLISTPINCTCTNLAENLEDTSHDVVSNYLKRERLTAGDLVEQAQRGRPQCQPVDAAGRDRHGRVRQFYDVRVFVEVV